MASDERGLLLHAKNRNQSFQKKIETETCTKKRARK